MEPGTGGGQAHAVTVATNDGPRGDRVSAEAAVARLTRKVEKEAANFAAAEAALADAKAALAALED